MEAQRPARVRCADLLFQLPCFVKLMYHFVKINEEVDTYINIEQISIAEMLF